MPGEPFDASDSGDSSPVFPLLFAGAFLLTLIGMGVWALIDRRRRAAEPVEPAEPEGGPTEPEPEASTAD
jgi:hypothetical protein